jgi:hypothetical protein
MQNMLNMHNMPHGTEQNMQQATLLGHLYAQVMLSTYWVAVLLSQWFCFHLKMYSCVCVDHMKMN